MRMTLPLVALTVGACQTTPRSEVIVPAQAYVSSDQSPVFHPDSVTTKPHLIAGSCTLPVYPPALAQDGISGEVWMSFLIDTNGRVDPASLSVVSATHEGFSQPALESVQTCRFRPGEIAGHPVRVRVRQPIRFRTF